ncbi:MAG: Na+/H+ antiporter [Candidatus Limnocylindria bacterium]
MELHLGPIELAFVVLVWSTFLVYVARRFGIADPILLVLGGVVLGFLFERVPDSPTFELEPDIVFLLFLPPILFGAAYFTPIRDFRANARPILLLAIGLVLFTTLVVGVVTKALVPDLPWAAAFALGAIVAPPDAVAATAVFQRLGVPRRIVTILEGESLINDASALIAYRVAVAAVLTGAFSLVDAGVAFVTVGAGGIAIGLVVGRLVTMTMSRTADPTMEIIVSFIAPIAAYLPAEELGLSGVLATVVAGLMTGRRASRVLSPEARLMGEGSWAVVIFLINAFVFTAIGLQLPGILAGIVADHSVIELVVLGAGVSLATIVSRIVWVFPATYLPRLLPGNGRERQPRPPARGVFIVSWAGMRGAVSLAAALALPFDFPQRDLILWLTFCVILATLVGQGLTLPFLIRRLGVLASSAPDAEEAHARLAALEAGLRRLDDLEVDQPGHGDLLANLRASLDHEASHVWAGGETTVADADRERLEHRFIRDSFINAQRDAVIRLRDRGIINDETLRRIERDLDLEALRAGD